MKKAVIILTDGFEEIEAVTVIDILRRAEIEVDCVSRTGKTIVKGSHGITIASLTPIEKVSKDADALILPGGPGTADLRNCGKTNEILMYYYEKEKIIGAICAAPSILGKAGILKGRKAVCFPGNEKYLEGAEILESDVCEDGNIITSRAAGTAVPFALAVTAKITGIEKSHEVGAKILYRNN
ncbi:MAG: DJ-1 family glyoxalase III [Fibrobacterota bacterium]